MSEKRDNQRRWSKDEIAVMREKYATEGLAAVMPLLNDRTEMSIRKKAGQLGISDHDHMTQAHTEAMWPLPAMDLIEQLACVALRKWRYPVNETTRFGVAMIGGVR